MYGCARVWMGQGECENKIKININNTLFKNSRVFNEFLVYVCLQVA